MGITPMSPVMKSRGCTLADRQTPIMFVRILEGGTGAASLASDEIIAAY